MEELSLAPSTLMAGSSRTFVELLKPLVPMTSSAGIPMASPILINGSPTFIFSEKEMSAAEKTVKKNTLVLKFPRGRPSIGNIKLPMVKRWGLASIPTIGIFDNRNIFDKDFE
ncbi:hypothetical protein CIPAW_04G159200 [Carya illinoinensis]|uniref:Uncharacterized protein n=1 Tax=Carya illinoinensis TaxID=32201 RepID=A0A8T1QWX0_CARIL|nr:hypothetical protein CIPAW_04G159200 [Carya illinoinensis]